MEHRSSNQPPNPNAPRPGSFPPLKRHPSLQPFSREHMGGLVQARNLLHAGGQPAPSEDQAPAILSVAEREAVLKQFIRVWRAELSGHFDDEERLLLPLTPSAILRDRLLAEHR